MGASSKTRKSSLKATWPKGCPPPQGYCEWHEWAKAQGAHGLKQSRCKTCGRWSFPQELNGLGTCADPVDCATFIRKYGRLTGSVTNGGPERG